jgi:hypothetical protein
MPLLCCAVLINFKDILSLWNGFFHLFPKRKKKQRYFISLQLIFPFCFPKEKKPKIFYLFAINFSICFPKEKKQRYFISLQLIFPFVSQKKKKEYFISLQLIFPVVSPPPKKKTKKKDILSLVCWRVGVCMRVSNHLSRYYFNLMNK